MKLFKTLLTLSAVAALSGCATAYSPVGNGILFTSVQGPVSVTDATAKSKTGTACASNVLGMVAAGDASLQAAKSNGGITKVSAVDHNSTTFLGLFGQFCTVVTGE